MKHYNVVSAILTALLFSSLSILTPPTALAEDALSAPTEIAAGTLDNSAANNLGHNLGKFHTYRIVSAIKLNDGTILLSYDGRPDGGDAPSPNSILQRRSTDGGKTWEAETFIHEGHVDHPEDSNDANLSYSDPCFVYDAETDTVFNFHVWAKDRGFADAVGSADDNDRNNVSVALSTSTDHGKTYTHRSLTAQIQEPGQQAAFASSGHGIQVKNGKYKGRLIVQFIGRYTDGSARAFSVYSDDHGQTWQRGKSVGTNMNENKVVELSDGTLMLNSRIPSGSPARYLAYSKDGGETWSEPTIDSTLIDPSNNASIIRKHSDAPTGSPQSKELLFSNTASTITRENGSVRYSCDDGATWPVIKLFQNGETQYSDLVELNDSTYGVFYEGPDKHLLWKTFTDEWLNPFCADFADSAVEIEAGATVPVTTTVTNNDTRTLQAGTATIKMSTTNADPGETPQPTQWSAEVVKVPEIAPGQSAKVTVNLTAPEIIRASAKGSSIAGDIQISAGEVTIRGDLAVTVTKGTAVVAHPDPSVLHKCADYVDGVTPGTNLIQNCNFEVRNSATGTYGDEWAVRHPNPQTVYVSSETLSDGSTNHFGMIGTGGFDSFFQQRIPTVPGKTYLYEADVRLSASDGFIPSAVFFTAKGWDKVSGKPNQGSTTQLSIGQLDDAINWTHKSITFVARNDLTDIGIIKWAPNDAEGHVAATMLAIDNVSVREVDSNGKVITPPANPATSGNTPSGNTQESTTSATPHNTTESAETGSASAGNSSSVQELGNTGSVTALIAVIAFCTLFGGTALLTAVIRSQKE